VRALTEYSDASNCNTYPKPLTSHAFVGLSEQENINFKIWLGLIGENEIEIAADQELEIHFVEAFKEQKNEHCKYINPAQKTSHIYLWFLQAEADKAWCEVVHGCQFWQLVQHVPTQEEFNKAFPVIELEYAPPMEPVVEPKPARQTKGKVKPARDEWTLDLFGGAA
jgi:hypothetical protein